MRDPIDTLTSLDTGDDVPPVPAAEIRRRGDRRRRRRVTAAGIGATLVLAAAVALPSMLTDGPAPIAPATPVQTPSSEPPSPDAGSSESTGGTSMLDDFPLDRYLPTGDDYQRVDPQESADGIEICGSTIWPAGADEAIGVMAIGPEQSETRWIGAFADADAASGVLEDARAVLADCERTGANDSLAVVTLEGDTGYDDVTFAVVDASGQPSGEVVQLMRVGSAVLVSSSGGEYTEQTAQDAADDLTTQSADLASEMCQFTEAGC